MDRLAAPNMVWMMKALDFRNPYEVSEEFVQQYNNASSLEDQERLEVLAYKMLERVKVSCNKGKNLWRINAVYDWIEEFKADFSKDIDHVCLPLSRIMFANTQGLRSLVC